MDYGVDEERVVELGGVAGDFSFHGQEAGGERFVPFDGEGGDVGEDESELIGGDVAGKWNGVEAGAADGGVRKQAFEETRPWLQRSARRESSRMGSMRPL